MITFGYASTAPKLIRASLTQTSSSLEWELDWERDRSSEVTDDFAKLRERGRREGGREEEHT